MNLGKQIATSVFVLGLFATSSIAMVNTREVSIAEQHEKNWQRAQARALEREKIAKEKEARDAKIEEEKRLAKEEEEKRKAQEQAEAERKAQEEAQAEAERLAQEKAEAERKAQEEAQQAQAQVQAQAPTPAYNGNVLTKSKGTIIGPSGKETYYNLDMSGVVSIMRGMGNTDEYWVREDGVKMLGDYVMIAAALDIRPRGSLVETSLGMGIVCDTGGFAFSNPTQIDIAVTW